MNNSYTNRQKMYRSSQQKTQLYGQKQQINYSKYLPFTIGSSNNYMLYYSNFCINCKDFINVLCKNPIYSRFIKINVSAKTNFPPFIKSVPTILVPGYTKPLVGREVFNWLENLSKKETKKQNKDIIPYSPGEMGCSMSDNYSYIDFKDADQPMEHSFVFVKKGEQKINTPSEDTYVDTNPRRIKGGISERKRIPFPQGLQNKSLSNSSENIYQQNTSSNRITPTISNNNNNSVEDAYNDLLSRRKIDMTTM